MFDHDKIADDNSKRFSPNPEDAKKEGPQKEFSTKPQESEATGKIIKTDKSGLNSILSKKTLKIPTRIKPTPKVMLNSILKKGRDVEDSQKPIDETQIVKTDFGSVIDKFIFKQSDKSVDDIIFPIEDEISKNSGLLNNKPETLESVSNAEKTPSFSTREIESPELWGESSNNISEMENYEPEINLNENDVSKEIDLDINDIEEINPDLEPDYILQKDPFNGVEATSKSPDHNADKFDLDEKKTPNDTNNVSNREIDLVLDDISDFKENLDVELNKDSQKFDTSQPEKEITTDKPAESEALTHQNPDSFDNLDFEYLLGDLDKQELRKTENIIKQNSQIDGFNPDENSDIDFNNISSYNPNLDIKIHDVDNKIEDDFTGTLLEETIHEPQTPDRGSPNSFKNINQEAEQSSEQNELDLQQSNSHEEEGYDNNYDRENDDTIHDSSEDNKGNDTINTKSDFHLSEDDDFSLYEPNEPPIETSVQNSEKPEIEQVEKQLKQSDSKKYEIPKFNLSKKTNYSRSNLWDWIQEEEEEEEEETTVLDNQILKEELNQEYNIEEILTEENLKNEISHETELIPLKIEDNQPEIEINLPQEERELDLPQEQVVIDSATLDERLLQGITTEKSKEPDLDPEVAKMLAGFSLSDAPTEIDNFLQDDNSSSTPDIETSRFKDIQPLDEEERYRIEDIESGDPGPLSTKTKWGYGFVFLILATLFGSVTIAVWIALLKTRVTIPSILVNVSMISLLLFLFLIVGRYLALIVFSFLQHIRNKSMNWEISDTFLKASILVPAYNEEVVIERSIKSLVELNYPNFEVIVINDGSNDRTLELAKNLEGIHHGSEGEVKVIVVTQKNAGKSEALNHGSKVCTGDVLVCVDGDSRLHPDTLKMALRH